MIMPEQKPSHNLIAGILKELYAENIQNLVYARNPFLDMMRREEMEIKLPPLPPTNAREEIEEAFKLGAWSGRDRSTTGFRGSYYPIPVPDPTGQHDDYLI